MESLESSKHAPKVQKLDTPFVPITNRYLGPPPRPNINAQITPPETPETPLKTAFATSYARSASISSLSSASQPDDSERAQCQRHADDVLADIQKKMEKVELQC